MPRYMESFFMSGYREPSINARMQGDALLMPGCMEMPY